MEDTLLLWDVMFATTERSAVTGPSSSGGNAASPSAAPAVNTSAMPDSSFKRALAPKVTPEASAGQSGQGFLLAEYIVIAMLLYVRQALMHGDNSYCLRRLLRYPPVEDVRVLLARALHFHNGWKALTADPTLTRDSWNPTATDHDGILAPRGVGVGSGVGSVPEGTTNPEAFQGPWQNISGDMGADAPLDGTSPEPSRGGNNRHQQSQGSRSSHQQQQQSQPGKRGSQSGSSSKTLFSDSFASLKSFMKGTLQKAAELPSHPPPASERTASQSKQPSPSPTNASKPAGPPPSRGSSGPVPAGSRKAPTSSGVSHFLSSSSGSSSSASPPASSHSSIVNGPSAAQHDELILLRKQLASREKEVSSLSASLYSLNQQLLDARAIQTQMGNLLAQSIEEMEREYARSQGEHLANEDGDDEEEAAADQISGNNNEKEQATETESVPADPAVSDDSETAAVVALDSNPALDSLASAASSAAPSSSSSASAPKRPPFSEDVLLSGLAEFKHVRDVLVGRLTLADIIDYLHTTTTTAAAAAAAGEGKKKNEGAEASSHSVRKQILSDVSSMHARQLESSRQSAKDSAAGSGGAGGGSSFPYNMPPPKPKAFTPLFETEVAPRDKVSELFALDESDAVPGVYPTVHKVTAQPPPQAAAGPLQNVSALSTAAAMGALNSSTSPLHANANTNANRIVDPLVSPPAAAAKSSSTVSAPSAAASSLLSGLLSSPTAGAGSGGSSSSAASASSSSKSSLFDSSPPGSPPFGGGGAARGAKTHSMFADDDDDDDTFPSTASSKLATGAGKKKPSVFALEEEDDSILLPSASQFKEPPRSFKAPPPKKKPVVAPAAAVAAPAPAAAAVSPASAGTAKSPASSAPVGVASPLHVSPSPVAVPAAASSSSSVASSTKSVAPEEDPLSWMGTGK